MNIATVPRRPELVDTITEEGIAMLRGVLDSAAALALPAVWGETGGGDLRTEDARVLCAIQQQMLGMRHSELERLITVLRHLPRDEGSYARSD